MHPDHNVQWMHMVALAVFCKHCDFSNSFMVLPIFAGFFLYCSETIMQSGLLYTVKPVYLWVFHCGL